MKKLAFLLIVCQSLGCSTESNLDCHALSEAITNGDVVAVGAEVNTILSGMKSNSIESDPLGHRENLQEVVTRLNENCENLEFSLSCYACIKTSPAMSEIAVTFPGGDIGMLDVWTGEDGVLEFAGIH